MSKEQLKHIFEQSACLTPKQIRGYATGKMVHEEAHAVEVHLLSCPFCSDAVSGVSEHKDTALHNLEKMDASFIANHFGVARDEVKISAKSTRKTRQTAFKSLEGASGAKARSSGAKMWKPIAAAAGLIGIAVIMWMMKDSIFPKAATQLAQETSIPETESRDEPEIVYRPTITDSADEVATEQVVDTPISEPEITTTLADQEQLAAVSKTEEKLKEQKAEEATLAAAKLAAQKDEEKKKQALVADNTQPAVTKTAVKVEERPRMGNSFDATVNNEYSGKAKEEVEKEEVKKEEVPPPPPPKKKVELGTARSGILKGDESFNDGKYKKALKHYQKVMFDPKSNQKASATLMAAKCHIAMDEMMQARTLLNSLIKENSTKKGDAASLLKQLPQE